MPKPASNISGQVERQRRYRAAHQLVSIDISRRTADGLALLRRRTGLSTDALIWQSLAALERALDGQSATQQRRGRSAPAGSKAMTDGNTPAASPERSAAEIPSPGDVATASELDRAAAKPARSARKPAPGCQEHPIVQRGSTSIASTDETPDQGMLDLFGA